MTPVSQMPPIDYCPSCEGRKAERQAMDIGEARARQAELQAPADPSATPPPGAAPAASGATVASGRPEAVGGSVQTLLSPDLAVQAALARPGIDAGSGEEAALRLRTAQAYGAS